MSLDKSIIWTREQYEDFFQSLTRKLLPKFNKKNIRPAYQNVGGYTAKNIINQQYDDGMSGFSNKDDFIYIKVQFTPGDESYVDDNDAVYMQRFIDVTYTIYGENSPTIALTLFSLLRTSVILMELEKVGLFFYGTNNVESARETINGQWWERNDFTFTVNECIKVENPNIPQLAKDIDVEVLVLNE